MHEEGLDQPLHIIHSLALPEIWQIDVLSVECLQTLIPWKLSWDLTLVVIFICPQSIYLHDGYPYANPARLSIQKEVQVCKRGCLYDDHKNI